MTVVETHAELITEVERLLIDWRFRQIVAELECEPT